MSFALYSVFCAVCWQTVCIEINIVPVMYSTLKTSFRFAFLPHNTLTCKSLVWVEVSTSKVLSGHLLKMK